MTAAAALVACPKVAHICSAGRGRRAATEMQTTFGRRSAAAERSYKEATTMYLQLQFVSRCASRRPLQN